MNIRAACDGIISSVSDLRERMPDDSLLALLAAQVMKLASVVYVVSRDAR